MTRFHSRPLPLLGAILLSLNLATYAARKPELPPSQTEAVEAATAGDAEEALKLLESSAEAGDSDAAYGAAEFHMTGTGTPKSVEDALSWYQRAADAGQASALLRLGEIYLNGFAEVEKDEARARFHLQAAGEGGATPAWSLLGQLCERDGNSADAKPEREKLFGEARSYYKKGAEADNLECQHRYYQLLATGKGGGKDLPTALEWLRKSALAGFPDSMNELGARYQDGNGVEKNEITAVGFFLAGAERNSLPAMTNLGLCYAKGVGVPQNHHQAGNWYARASKANYPAAQYLLGQLFEEGLGTDKNPVFAYVNYRRAAEAGLDPAKTALKALEEKMTPEQLDEAAGLAKPKTPAQPES